MDLLRLGLERGSSATQAVEVMVALLDKYGQWGSAMAGLGHEKGSYENAFIVGDSSGGWLLETTGRDWVARRLEAGVHSLSNQLTTRNSWDRESPGLRKSFTSPTGRQKLDFALEFSAHNRFARQVSHLRWKRTGSLLQTQIGHIGVGTMKQILRDHFEGTFLEGPQFHQFLPDFQTICMHDSPAGFTWGNTATSFILQVDAGGRCSPLLWWSYLTPCCSVFLPMYPFETELPDQVLRAGTAGVRVQQAADVKYDQFHEASLWWRMHRLVEYVGKDPSQRYGPVRKAFDAIEKECFLNVSQGASPGKVQMVLNSALDSLQRAISKFEDRWAIA
jgi:secernin